MFWENGECPSGYSMCVPAKYFSHVWLFATLWTVAHQAPLSMGFSKQEYCYRLWCPSSGDLPDPGIKPKSLLSPALAGRFFTTSTTWEALRIQNIYLKKKKNRKDAGSGTKRWKQKWPHICHHNDHYGFSGLEKSYKSGTVKRSEGSSELQILAVTRVLLCPGTRT